ncbi:hypothetical protein HXX76_013791 [Chlamydomonas incerta]|uniref:Cilium assembly protein DZIP1 N-terminal domain-containing protein n=1 Tax=Chlamydomonas incerta TaxID=51695 RepID=A0A835SDP2_CHLIN|nr:hypothetical protein HXX76_013791 [Chlamydomonas incerta]|eukprot:KAG2425377.1 hypothetical protein HXX76_013791 [Chlamydomonas incerta]
MASGLGTSFQRGTAAFGPWVGDPYVDHTGLRDQMATMTTAPTFPPFKFEPRRARIDWRLLHGIDINSMMRDVDLDTLEKIVNIVAFGDIEAEDTRHLTELNFIKIFRLSQMMIEYLLYVQECLQGSNGWLQQDRSNMDKYIQAARLRIREMEANLKMNKRELRRARKTIKTYELLAVLNEGKGLKTATGVPTATVMVAPPSPPPAQQTARSEQPNPANAAMEALLRKELSALAERLSRATVEAQTLRSERDEMYQAVKELESVVRTRQFSGPSSPPGSARTTPEQAQFIQSLQDQLNRATMEITKLRNEKGDLVDELDRVNGDKRQLQDEKARLLTEIASRPADASGTQTSPRDGGDNLGSMLLDAERQKANLQEQLDEARAEITALQKQLMKAMKATAFAPLGGPLQSQSSDETVQRVMRDMEAAKSQLERELADLRKTYNDDIRTLQEELEITQAKAVDADRKLADLRSGGDVHQATVRLTPGAGGLVKVVEERRYMPEEPEDDSSVAASAMRRQKEMLAETEAMNERLNTQLSQLKEERNALASDVDRLRAQLEGRSPQAPGDPSIGRDWRTEELERLKQELDGSRQRCSELEDGLRDRDAHIERLRTTIRDLQMELDERNRRAELEAAQLAAEGRVRHQVKEYERLAGPGSQHFKTSSFSFVPDDMQPELPAAGAGGSGLASMPSVETPTSVRGGPGGLPPTSPQQVQPRQSPEAGGSPELQPARISPQAQRPPVLSPNGSRWLQRIPRPAPSDAYDILQGVLQHVQGKQPEQIQMQLQEEIRPQTLNPYEFENDDEARFRAMMPHEVPERRGVLSVEPHELQDLAVARSMLTDTLLEVVDDQLAQFGLDPRVQALSDKTYAACMVELERRRSLMLERVSPAMAKRATDLRDGMLTHLELIKREMQKEQQAVAQKRLQEQALKHAEDKATAEASAAAAAAAQAAEVAVAQQAAAAAAAATQPLGGISASGSAGPSSELLPSASGSQPVRSGSASGLRTGSTSLATPAVPAPGSAFAAPTAVAAGALASGAHSSAATSHTESPTVAVTAAKPQLPAFPARQSSIGRSAPSETNTDDLRNMLPGGGFSRPAAEAAPSAAPSAATAAATATAASSVRASPIPSPLNQSLAREAAAAGERPRSSNLNASISSVTSLNSSIRTGPGRSSAAVSGPSGAGGAAAAGGAFPVAFQGLTKEAAAAGPTEMVSGFSRPAAAAASQPQLPQPQKITPGAAAAAAATAPSGNMNMSIRSVRQYEESEYDEEEDVAPPQPKALARVTKEEDDEYAVTEDEEGQEDQGIEDDEEGFSPIGHGLGSAPRILSRVQSPPRASAVQPSRLGPQRTSAVAGSRQVAARAHMGWGMDEPLQLAPPPPAPAAAAAGGRPSETADTGELESLQSFNGLSTSLPRGNPGAWGSPGGTMRKQSATVQQPRELSKQLSTTSKQSGWNETIKSFGATSVGGDEIQMVQDVTAMESFTGTESIRPARAMAPPARGSVQPAQPAPLKKPVQYDDDDFSDVEEL